MIQTRGSSLLALVALVAVGASACGDDEATTDERGEATEIVEPVPAVEPPPAPPPDRNPDGSLIESDETVGGLRLPRGLREVAFHERQHFYEGPYVPEAYVNYFGPRLLTGTVERLPGGGARYVEATAREARGGVVVMDVLISGAAEGTSLVTIDERPAAPVDPPSEAELRRQLRESLGEER
ncbi:MAG: hypothetical protein U0353_34685 [Sandaracinus sp.]